MKQPRILRVEEVRERLGGVSRQTLDRWEREGRLPRRRRIGPRSVGWIESEIDRFVRTLASASEQRVQAV